MQCARRGFPVSGSEAMAIVTLLQFAEALQLNMKAAVKDDLDWYQRFMPLSEMVFMCACVSEPADLFSLYLMVVPFLV